jgi:hypothetical protein
MRRGGPTGLGKETPDSSTFTISWIASWDVACLTDKRWHPPTTESRVTAPRREQRGFCSATHAQVPSTSVASPLRRTPRCSLIREPRYPFGAFPHWETELGNLPRECHRVRNRFTEVCCVWPYCRSRAGMHCLLRIIRADERRVGIFNAAAPSATTPGEKAAAPRCDARIESIRSGRCRAACRGRSTEALGSRRSRGEARSTAQTRAYDRGQSMYRLISSAGDDAVAPVPRRYRWRRENGRRCGR